MKETREENHMAKTHRGITYISVLFLELISNYICIFWGLFGINYVIFFVVNSHLSLVTSRGFAFHQHEPPLCFDYDLGDFSDLNGPHPQGLRSSA